MKALMLVLTAALLAACAPSSMSTKWATSMSKTPTPATSGRQIGSASPTAGSSKMAIARKRTPESKPPAPSRWTPQHAAAAGFVSNMPLGLGIGLGLAYQNVGRMTQSVTGSQAVKTNFESPGLSSSNPEVPHAPRHRCLVWRRPPRRHLGPGRPIPGACGLHLRD